MDVQCYIVSIWFSFFTYHYILFFVSGSEHFFRCKSSARHLALWVMLTPVHLCFSYYYPICNCRSCSGTTVLYDAMYHKSSQLVSEFAPPPPGRCSSMVIIERNRSGNILRFPNPLVKFVMFPCLIYQSSYSKQEHDATPAFSFIAFIAFSFIAIRINDFLLFNF